MPATRRRFARAPYVTPVRIRHGETVLDGRSEDVSVGGLLVLARQAFERSLTFDAHDSTAYTNLGLLELAAGDQAAARRFFAEALWLTPDSATARQGLARTR